MCLPRSDNSSNSGSLRLYSCYTCNRLVIGIAPYFFPARQFTTNNFDCIQSCSFGKEGHMEPISALLSQFRVQGLVSGELSKALIYNLLST